MEAGNLYELTPAEFERLVAELLSQETLSDVKVAGGPDVKGIDVIGLRDGQRVAVQVKHKTSLRKGEIRYFAERYFADPSTPRSLLFVTSAEVLEEEAAAAVPPGCSLQVFGRQDVLRLLSQHPAVATRFFKVAIARTRRQRRTLLLGTLFAWIALIVSLVNVYSMFFSHKPPLDRRIETVEKALSSMRDLENYLSQMKQDLVDTENATQVINKKYAQAKELERLTAPQMDALRATLQSESWHRTVLNYILGFLFGVAASFVASVLYAKWQQRKAVT